MPDQVERAVACLSVVFLLYYCCRFRMSLQLNPPQREAIRYLDGPLLVLAGAGSGKTRVITQKIAHLVEQCGYEARHIAAITFTNKAAREMAERVGQLLPGKASSQLNVSTFHSLGVRILRAECKLLGLKPQFSILDSADAQSILAELSKQSDKATLRQLSWKISAWKNAMISPEAAPSHVQDEMDLVAARLYADYERTLRAYQAVDFDDLIGVPVKLFDEHPEARERWQSRLRYLLVDEYQDTNRSQYALLKQLVGPRAAFTAVGDDDQAIYAWRGADVENLRNLQRDFPRLQVIKLEQNYRSSGRILQAANTLIANNEKLFEKKLWSEFGLGDQVEVRGCRDPEEEALTVAMKIAAHKFEHRTCFADYAVLYRGNHQSRAIEAALREQKIPYMVSGGQSFFERAEIKDVLSYLRLICNNDDDPSFIRASTTPKRGIGAGTLEALGEYAGKRQVSLYAASFELGFQDQIQARQLTPLTTFSDFIQRMEWRAEREPARQVLEDLLNAIGYERYLFDTFEPREAESKWNNVREFVDWLSRKSEGGEPQYGDVQLGDGQDKKLPELVQTIALITMLEKNKEEADAVQLATLHAAKGLEFKHVFLIGCEEGLLPHRESVDGGKIEEERRLMYVGVTRAQRSLTITHCEQRPSGKEKRSCEISRFIAELGNDLKQAGKEAQVPTAETRKANSAKLQAWKERLAAKG